MTNVTEESRCPSPSERLVNLVIDSYWKAKTMPIMVAHSHYIEDRAEKWSPRTAEFICDCEHAFEAALGGDKTLTAALTQMLMERAAVNGIVDEVSEQQIAPGARKRVIQRCSRVFQARELHPAAYFNWSRKRRAA